MAVHLILQPTYTNILYTLSLGLGAVPGGRRGGGRGTGPSVLDSIIDVGHLLRGLQCLLGLLLGLDCYLGPLLGAA